VPTDQAVLELHQQAVEPVELRRAADRGVHHLRRHVEPVALGEEAQRGAQRVDRQDAALALPAAARDAAVLLPHDLDGLGDGPPGLVQHAVQGDVGAADVARPPGVLARRLGLGDPGDRQRGQRYEEESVLHVTASCE
jgi:hypothetical protein